MRLVKPLLRRSRFCTMNQRHVRTRKSVTRSSHKCLRVVRFHPVPVFQRLSFLLTEDVIENVLSKIKKAKTKRTVWSVFFEVTGGHREERERIVCNHRLKIFFHFCFLNGRKISPERLPPPERAAYFRGLRAYHQVMQ